MTRTRGAGVHGSLLGQTLNLTCSLTPYGVPECPLTHNRSQNLLFVDIILDFPNLFQIFF